MGKYYVLGAVVGISFLLLSNAANPPDAHTGAPGENFCTNCHSLNGSSNQGTISVEGFPASINPGETYTLTVVNRNTNDGAVKGGFQLTILGPTNTRAGDMSSPSANSALSVTGGRQYFEHHPAVAYPDSNVLKWTVQWKAPALASGSTITYYTTGIIANGNANSTGDRMATSKGSGMIVLAGTKDVVNVNPIIYPNPGTDFINIQLPDETRPDGLVYFFDISGRLMGEEELHNGIANTNELPSLVYLLKIRYNNTSYIARWVKI